MSSVIGHPVRFRPTQCLLGSQPYRPCGAGVASVLRACVPPRASALDDTRISEDSSGGNFFPQQPPATSPVVPSWPCQQAGATAEPCTPSMASAAGAGSPLLSSHPAEDVYQWPGLHVWRARGIDTRRGWGSAGQTSDMPAPGALLYEDTPLAGSLVACALQVLNTACPRGKAAITHRAWRAYSMGELPLHCAGGTQRQKSQLRMPPSQNEPQRGRARQDLGEEGILRDEPAAPRLDQADMASLACSVEGSGAAVPAPPDRPARPEKPQLVPPKEVPTPDRTSPLPLAAHLLHNLAHIELNAIDLAWDTVARFAHIGLPDGFYEDFARVADDESRHLGWCLQRLAEMGHDYGDMPAHNLLWEGAIMSAGDLGARLAIIPMSQEARGLDAGPRLVEKLTGNGDVRSAAIVNAIATEEKAHVAVGALWFGRVCWALGMPGSSTFKQWLASLCPDLLKGPFNHDARVEVGLPREWYDIALWPSAEREALALPPPRISAPAAGSRSGKSRSGRSRRKGVSSSPFDPSMAISSLPADLPQPSSSQSELPHGQSEPTALLPAAPFERPDQISPAQPGGNSPAEKAHVRQPPLPPPPSLSLDQLQALRVRLASMVDMELSQCAN